MASEEQWERLSRLERFVTQRVEHGATQLGMAEMMKQAEIIWPIGVDDPISKTCIHAEEWLNSGARSCRRALDVMDRIERTEGQDVDLMAALKRYVEETCEAIKQVDNALKRKGADLATLLHEVPNEASGEASWRDIIGRRDVLAHHLLMIDDERVHREARRDFESLYQLLSRVYFAPIKTNFEGGRGSPEMILKAEKIQQLRPAEPGNQMAVGESVVFVYEDEERGFIAFRMGRSDNNRALIAGPPGTYHLSVWAF